MGIEWCAGPRSVSKMRGILEPHKMNKPACYSLQVWCPWLQQLYVLVAFTLTRNSCGLKWCHCITMMLSNLCFV